MLVGHDDDDNDHSKSALTLMLDPVPDHCHHYNDHDF